MKILSLADINPKESIKKIVSENQIDIIFLLGDLEKPYLWELQDINLPKLGVYGNHCSGQYFPDLGVTNMHLNTLNLLGYTFGGFEGSVRHKSNPFAKMYSQEEAEELLKDFKPVDIFLSHCPPMGINDENDLAHQGFKALRDYLDRTSPKYFFHGHTYPNSNNQINLYNSTKIVYVTGHKIITI